jgi:hypothetical protein
MNMPHGSDLHVCSQLATNVLPKFVTLVLLLLLVLLQASRVVLPHDHTVQFAWGGGTSQCGLGGRLACFRLQFLDTT